MALTAVFDGPDEMDLRCPPSRDSRREVSELVDCAPSGKGDGR